ncbi:MAG: hypothetical protein IJ056_04385 [Acidaminococcaceae bacterium]|nr:hypothetical protein [Acidaminococcaceae bacterium]
MFCKNCFRQLSDGARFCRIAAGHFAGGTGSAEKTGAGITGKMKSALPALAIN